MNGNEITSHDAMQDMVKGLSELAEQAFGSRDENEALEFLSALEQAIKTTYYDGYESIPYSIGMDWLRRNDQIFIRVFSFLPEGMNDPIWFYQSLMDEHNLWSLVYYNELLAQVGEQNREPFVRELFAAHPPVDGGSWVKVFVKLGISRETIAEMVLQQLQNTTINTRYNVPDFVKQFIQLISGHMYYSGEWRRQNGYSAWVFEDRGPTICDQLTDQQLIEALLICEAKYPGILFHGGRPSTIDALEARFLNRETEVERQAGRQRIIELLVDAARSLTSQGLQYASPESIDLLPTDEKRNLVERLDKLPLGLLVQVASLVGDGRQLFDNHVSKCVGDNIVAAFCDAQSQLKQMPDRSLAEHIDRVMVNHLRTNGFVVGKITVGKHRGGQQLQVESGKMRFVERTGDYRCGKYYPREDDRVVFHPGSGRVLVPGRVTAVTFTLVSRPSAK